MTNMATPQHNSCPGGNEIYKFGGHFPGYHYYIINLYDPCSRAEKKSFTEIIYFHFMTCMTTPQHNNPCPRGHQIKNFGKSFLDHPYYILFVSAICPRVEKIFLKKYTNFTLFNPKLSMGRGSRNLQFCTLQLLQTKLIKDEPFIRTNLNLLYSTMLRAKFR